MTAFVFGFWAVVIRLVRVSEQDDTFKATARQRRNLIRERMDLNPAWRRK